MARGVTFPVKISSAQHTIQIPQGMMQAQTISLEVLKEKDEAIVGRLEDLGKKCRQIESNNKGYRDVLTSGNKPNLFY